MGYDLSLTVAGDDQIEFLRRHPEYTRHFLEAHRPTTEVVEVSTSWFRRRETVRTREVDLSCQWPDSPPECVELYLRGGLYFLLNGTHETVEAVTNFPNVGGRYRGEMLGSAVELGEAGVGFVHAFKSREASLLQQAVAAIDPLTVEERARLISESMEWEDAIPMARDDMAALREIVALAVGEGRGLLWFWG